MFFSLTDSVAQTDRNDLNIVNIRCQRLTSGLIHYFPEKRFNCINGEECFVCQIHMQVSLFILNYIDTDW